LDPNTPMQGKVCLVTGATSGIGAVTARELARRGAHVIIVGRNRARCEATLEQIRTESGNTSAEFYLADLSAQGDIRRLAEEVRARHPQIHVLVNNAGGMFPQRRESVDGTEMTIALNHIGYFLLTNLLLEPLKAAAPARVVSVASDAHTWAKSIDFDDLQSRKRYGMFRSYAQSKLANLLFTFELARRLVGTGVTANALHPGFVATNIFVGPGIMARFIMLAAAVVAISPEEGAKTSVYLASSPEVEGVTGQYFVKCKSAKPSPAALDADAARRLWDVSAELTRL
jgi:NAD(P)-dependent dehydrogenase (short-subunit alcohol dehydrogenase family)